MKVLFVCQGNVGRSQVAEGLFNKVSNHHATSAGIGADEALEKQRPESNKLKDADAQSVISYMQSHGIDVSENERTQLASHMVHDADKVFVLADKSSWPDYLLNSDKVTFWDIYLTPGMGEEGANKAFEQIRQNVESLADELC